MVEHPWTRYVGWAGIASAAYIVVAFVVLIASDFPTYADPSADVRSWLDSGWANVLVGQMATDFVVDMLLFVPFVIGAGYVLERASPGQPILPRLSMFGGLVGVAILWMGWMNSITLYLGPEQLSDPAITILMRTDAYLFGTALNMANALWIGAGGLSILRSGRFPRWLGWIGIGGGVALGIGGMWVLEGDPEGALGGVGLIGVVAMVAWMVGMGRTILGHGVGLRATVPTMPIDGATADEHVTR